MDGVALAYSFTVVPSVLIGAPEEKSSTRSHRVIVSISDTRLKGWHISDVDLPKVLFEYGKRLIRQMVESVSLPKEYTIRMPMITTVSNPGALPFEFSRLEMPNGTPFDAEVRRNMVFKT